MISFEAIEEFKRKTSENSTAFEMFSSQEKAFNKIKKIIEKNIVNSPYDLRRFSLIIYGASGVGKTFIIRSVLKALEFEGKISSNDYLYCSKFNDIVKIKHYDLIYKDYDINIVNDISLEILKRYLKDKNVKLVIFDELREDLYLNMDFSAAGYRYNRNGKGVIWILSFEEGFPFNVNDHNYLCVKIAKPTSKNLIQLKEKFFAEFEDIQILKDTRTIWELIDI